MELLERQTQLEELTRDVREAGTNAGEIAFVGGEAGAGKSVLVEQFTRQAGRGVRVLWGHCDALQTSRVLGPVTEVLAALSAASGTAGAPSLSREQLFSRLLERLSPPNPLSIVVLEDLHWADEATLDFVRFLGRRIQRTRCLLIVTYRDDELTPAHPLRTVLGELTGEHAARLRVDALSLAAVEQLARGTGRDARRVDRKSTRLNSSHRCISYAVFCVKQKEGSIIGGFARAAPIEGLQLEADGQADGSLGEHDADDAGKGEREPADAREGARCRVGDRA